MTFVIYFTVNLSHYLKKIYCNSTTIMFLSFLLLALKLNEAQILLQHCILKQIYHHSYIYKINKTLDSNSFYICFPPKINLKLQINTAMRYYFMLPLLSRWNSFLFFNSFLNFQNLKKIK